jgi:multiple sugar transport system permease protein
MSPKKSRNARTRLAHATLLLPAAAVLVPLLAIIVVQGASLITHDENLSRPGSGTAWVGLDNFARAFTDPTLLGSIRVTVLYVIDGVGLEIILGVGIALLLNGKVPGKGVIRAIVLIPMVLTPVVAGLMWRLLLDPTSGFVNYLLGVLGLGSDHAFLSQTATALPAVIMVEVWQNTPFVIIIVLAGLESLDQSPLEAAQVDGAGRWQALRYVTLPMLSPVLTVVLLLRVIDAVKTFALIITMTQGGPGTSTLVISSYVYRTGFQTFDIGYSTTLGLIVSVAMVILLFPTAGRLMGLGGRKAAS